MILVTFSVVVTIGVLNISFRTPTTHKVKTPPIFQQPDFLKSSYWWLNLSAQQKNPINFFLNPTVIGLLGLKLHG